MRGIDDWLPPSWPQRVRYGCALSIVMMLMLAAAIGAHLKAALITGVLADATTHREADEEYEQYLVHLSAFRRVITHLNGAQATKRTFYGALTGLFELQYLFMDTGMESILSGILQAGSNRTPAAGFYQQMVELEESAISEELASAASVVFLTGKLPKAAQHLQWALGPYSIDVSRGLRSGRHVYTKIQTTPESWWSHGGDTVVAWAGRVMLWYAADGTCEAHAQSNQSHNVRAACSGRGYIY